MLIKLLFDFYKHECSYETPTCHFLKILPVCHHFLYNHNALHCSCFTLQNDLVETGVASETNARDTINKLCLPLVGERQASFEKLLENMDVSEML